MRVTLATSWGMLGCGIALLSGCLAMGMHGTQENSSRQQRPKSTTFVQDVQDSALTSTLTVEGSAVGEMSTLSVRIMDRRTHEPVSGARVVITIHPEWQRIDERPDGCVHTESEGRVCAEVEEGPDKGGYVLKHTFREHGMYRVTARVMGIGAREIALPTVIEVTQAVDHRDRDRRVLLGVAGVMLVMVIVMVLL